MSKYKGYRGMGIERFNLFLVWLVFVPLAIIVAFILLSIILAAPVIGIPLAILLTVVSVSRYRNARWYGQ